MSKIGCVASRWRILDDCYTMPQYYGIYVEERRLNYVESTYAVVLNQYLELSKDGNWHPRPFPRSDITSDYLTNHRWDDCNEAINAAQVAAERLLKELGRADDR